MKKIIILLFLSTLVKAQIVLPKSTTTFSNVNAVGSMTVGGNLRVTGSETITGNAVISKLRVGSTTAPSATLDVTGTMSVSGTSTLTGAAKQTNTLNYEGNTTWNTNQTNTLTTGNTGTVAVLSDAVFPVNLSLGNFNPADGSSYYLGNIPISGFSFAGAATGTVVLPYNCTLVSWQYYTVTGGTMGSGESYTLQVAGTTTVNLSSVITNTTTYVGVSGSGLSTNFTAGDVMNVKLIAPTLATNPTSVYSGITLWFVRRQ
jgi:hypothetical protein